MEVKNVNIDISRKVVVITGASKGIGAALALAFAKEPQNKLLNVIKKLKKLYLNILKNIYHPKLNLKYFSVIKSPLIQKIKTNILLSIAIVNK